jgi:large subunit ribosomal protein L21
MMSVGAAVCSLGHNGDITMYAVIRAGGKQYRVAPGDVLRLETQTGAKRGKVEFGDVLAVSSGNGQIARAQGALVTGEVLGEGRGKKVLVFHYKRKKQYKKIAGHRQPFTSVRITEITFDGQKFTAPALEKKQPKPKMEPKEVKAAPRHKAEAAAARPAAKKKAAAPKKSAAKKSPGKKK